MDRIARRPEPKAMKIIERIMDVYARMDRDVARFQLKTGLRCENGCGTCCTSTAVQTSVLEMLPMAREIFREGGADAWLARLDDPARPEYCVLYRSERAPEEPGHCRYYPWRPTVCRLFGFATVHTRSGIPALSVCRLVKQSAPEAVAVAMASASDAPCFSDAATWVYGLDPGYGSRRMPINDALRMALMRIGLQMQAAYGERMGNDTAA